jgi:hypothetical protein
VSVLKSSGYGDGRTGSGKMPDAGDWMGPERNGRTPTGIPVPGTSMIAVPLAGQPPVVASTSWEAGLAGVGSIGYGM